MASKTHFSRSGGNQWVSSFYPTFPFVGNVYYADSNVASAGNGYSPESAFATINAAVAACTADNGDVVIVAPNHVETVIAAGTLTIAVAGVTILGLGLGRQRPKINYTTAAAASVNITAARVTLDNLVFTPTGFAAITAAINISAADVTIQNCEMETATATNQAVLGILTTAGANRFKLYNCFIHGSLNAGTTSQISLVGGDSIIIENNVIIGACTTSAGNIAGATTDSTNLVIHNNRILNSTASSTKAIVLTASSTGFITNNRLCILSSTAPVTGAAMNVGGNTYSAAAGITAGTASTI